MDFLNLIQKVQAQGADSLASPTFPYTPPGSTDNGTVTPATGRNIILQSDSTSVKVQTEFKVRIYIDTKTTAVKGFSVNVSFDPNYFQVADSDDTTDGTQIDYLDSTFTAKTNTVNNSTGLINLQAEVSSSSQASTLTRTVAEITFVPLKKGSSKITIVETNSTLLNASSVDVLDNTNSLTFTIGAQEQQVQPNNGTDQGDTIIPGTGLFDSASLITATIGGILLIATGIYIIRLSRVTKRVKSKSN